MHHITNSDNPSKFRSSCQKARGDTLFCRFLLCISLNTQTEDGAITYNLWSPQETVAARIVLYKNTKVNVRSPDGDTDFFEIFAGNLQGDTLALYLFIIFLDNGLRISLELMK